MTVAPVYQRDGITLYHGDCLAILPQLEAGSVDAVVTDENSGIICSYEESAVGQRAAVFNGKHRVGGSPAGNRANVSRGGNVAAGDCRPLQHLAGGNAEGNASVGHKAQAAMACGRSEWAIQARQGNNDLSKDGGEESLFQLWGDQQSLCSPQKRRPPRQPARKLGSHVHAVPQQYAQAELVELHSRFIVTDPPYGMKYSSGWCPRPIDGDGDTAVRDALLSAWDGPAVVFGKWNCPRPKNTRARLVWSKGNWPGMGDLSFPWGPSDEEIYIIGDGFVGRRSGTVLHCNRITGGATHPNEKPVSLIVDLLEKIPPYATILDPFMGSGTTGVACIRTGRKFIGIELERRYVDIAISRIEKAFAEKAELLPIGGVA